MKIPITITAKNEERALASCIDGVSASIRHAEAMTPCRFDLLVVLDDCTDGTEAIAHARGVKTIRSSGGKVEAQRAGLREAPFCIFVDADVIIAASTLEALVTTMIERRDVQVAFPPKVPLRPSSRSALAHAIHVYNRERGFSSQRSWFNGKCFAIRDWHIPTRAELTARIAKLPRDRFYDYAAGMRIDDIYLSRRIVAEHGHDALAETKDGCVYFRAPETWRGMYRYYRRMRMELERMSAMFPEFEQAHARFGSRHADRIADASRDDRRAYTEFQLALMVCKFSYRTERAYYQYIAHSNCPAWPAVEETKCSLDIGIPA